MTDPQTRSWRTAVFSRPPVNDDAGSDLDRKSSGISARADHDDVIVITDDESDEAWDRAVQQDLMRDTPPPVRPSRARAARSLSMEDRDCLFRAFTAEDRYPQPPSNLAAQASLEMSLRRAMTPEEQERLWEKTLRPWSDNWYRLFNLFMTFATDNFVAGSEVSVSARAAKALVDEFFNKNGSARPESFETFTI